jgi:ABC-type nitrate/sulfonate/bicarbonate transport system ATPase subunit
MYDASSSSSTSSSYREEQGVRVQGSVAYASQQAWIRNASIKQNILFGLDFDENAYRRTIDACCLQQDFSELPFGDETHIGERGVNLSGGQKARIALARAVYADTDVVLLDDILAALDAIVARKVFERCILGLLAGKTRLLVTHSEDVMASPAVDVHLEAVDGCITIVSSRNPDPVAGTTRCSSSIREIAYSLSSDAASGPSKVGSVTESEEKDKGFLWKVIEHELQTKVTG